MQSCFLHVRQVDLVWMFLGFLYPVCVQELSKLWIPWYACISGELWYLDILWTIFGFPWIQRMANVCPAAAWPDGKWENYEIHTLTHFCLPIFQSILANKNDEKRTKVGSRGQKLDLMGTKLGFWRHILVIYGTRTYLGHMLDVYWIYSRHRISSGQK